MSVPLVSVVMPAHNYGEFLAGAIESILGQVYPHFELVIVDDASTDATPDIVARYQDSRLRYMRRATCSGSGVVPRNDGIAMSSGELIAVADADDISLADRLACQVEFLSDHPEVDLLGGGLLPVDRRNRRMGPPVLKPVYRQPHTYRRELLSGTAVLVHGTMMFRARILTELHLEGYGDYVSSGDTEFLMRASRHARFCNLRRVLIRNRKHGASLTWRLGRHLRQAHHTLFAVQELIWVREQLGEDVADLKAERNRLRTQLAETTERWRPHPPDPASGTSDGTT